jgi:predicted dienelactone hydrolase
MARLGDDANAPAALSAETIASIARAGASYKDPRIMAVFAIAPALGMAFDAGSFLGLDVPVALIGGTADTTVPVATNIRRIADLLPRARVTMLPGAGHYTFLNSCLPSEDERRAAICVDNPGVDRDAVHARTVEQAVAFFAETLAAKD